MKYLSLIASALAMLGLTACEKGLVDGVADVAPTGQAANSVLQVQTRSGGSAVRSRYVRRDLNTAYERSVDSCYQIVFTAQSHCPTAPSHPIEGIYLTSITENIGTDAVSLIIVTETVRLLCRHR